MDVVEAIQSAHDVASTVFVVVLVLIRGVLCHWTHSLPVFDAEDVVVTTAGFELVVVIIEVMVEVTTGPVELEPVETAGVDEVLSHCCHSAPVEIVTEVELVMD